MATSSPEGSRAEAELGEPLVSVIVAVRNGEEFLGAAIASALSQTWSRR